MPNNLLYCGTYTDLSLQTGDAALPPSGSEGIYVFKYDSETGQLSAPTVAARAVNPSFLAMDGDERFLFAVNETREVEGADSGAVSSFSVDRESGELTFLNQVPSGGANPCHLAVSDDGRFLLVANWETASVAVFPIAEDGRLAPFVDLHTYVPTDERDPHAHFVMPAPNRPFVVATDTGTDRVMIYRQDAGTGKLTPNDPPFGQTHHGGSPRHLAFSPDGRFLFANGESDCTLSVFRYDPVRGSLDHIQYMSTLPEGMDAGDVTTSQILVHPDGRFVYIANRGADSIAIFRIDPESGQTAAIGFEPTRGRIPRNFTIDPGGRFLYAANQESDSIECFAIVPETGLLDHVGRVASVPAPTCLLFTAT
jgi:6-phosphogluconolactonase